MWFTPAPPRASGSSISSTKLLVPSGGLIQESCGEMLSPTQFALFGAFALLLAAFTGSMPPSLKVVEEISNTFACANAAVLAHKDASTIPPTSATLLITWFMGGFLRSAPCRGQGV